MIKQYIVLTRQNYAAMNIYRYIPGGVEAEREE